MSEQELPKPGDLIGVRYRIESLLGQGGMGAVFAALNQATGRAVAIKWMLPGAARSQDSLARFLSEARATAKIEHPNVIQILDVGQDGAAPFLVMERLRGQSLADRLEKGGRIPPLETLEIMVQACKGVAEAHSEGIIHRDLKPDNIFLCEGKDGSPRPPKVLDFGISKLYDQEGSTSLTQTGIAMGTPQYMSPEQLNAPPTADARFDVYAMGIVLYECLTGHPPYRAEGLFELVQQIASGNPTPIRVVAPDVPSDLEAVAMRAMHVHRDMRYPTMQALIDDLDRVLARMRAGAPAPIPQTGGHGPAAHPGSYPGGYGAAHAPTPGTAPIAGGGWTGPSGYGAPSSGGYGPPSGGYGAGTGGYGNPPSGPVHPSGAVPAKSGGGGLVIGAVVAVVGLGLLAIVGIGGAFLIFGGDDSTAVASGSGGNPVGGPIGGPVNGPIGGQPTGEDTPAANPRDPQIELTFTGDCAPRFNARRMVIGSVDSLQVTSTTLGGITGSLQMSLNDMTGTVNVSTRQRMDTQMVINLMQGQQIWTNLALDAGPVSMGRAEDPIRGSLTITQYDSELAQSDLTFDDVTLQNMRTGTLCTINGRLRTTGTTYGI